MSRGAIVPARHPVPEISHVEVEAALSSRCSTTDIIASGTAVERLQLRVEGTGVS